MVYLSRPGETDEAAGRSPTRCSPHGSPAAVERPALNKFARRSDRHAVKLGSILEVRRTSSNSSIPEFHHSVRRTGKALCRSHDSTVTTGRLPRLTFYLVFRSTFGTVQKRGLTSEPTLDYDPENGFRRGACPRF